MSTTRHFRSHDLLDVRDSWLVTASARPGCWRWDDPAIETHWLPVVGPSAWVLFRWLNRQLDGAFDAERITIARATMAAELGLGGGDGRNSFANRALSRAHGFGLLVADTTTDTIHVRRALDPARVRARVTA